MSTRNDGTTSAPAGGRPATGESQRPTPTVRDLWKSDKSSFIMAGLFLGGILVVYLMGAVGRTSQALAEPQGGNEAIDAAFSQLNSGTGPWFADRKAAGVVGLLQDKPSRRQLPESDLRRSPFVFDPAFGSQTQPTQPAKAVDGNDPEAKDLEARSNAANKLQLESILVGEAGSTAMISGKLVKEGQEIEGWVVRKIHPNKVVLAWEDHTFVLMLR